MPKFLLRSLISLESSIPIKRKFFIKHSVVKMESDIISQRKRFKYSNLFHSTHYFRLLKLPMQRDLDKDPLKEIFCIHFLFLFTYFFQPIRRNLCSFQIR